MRKKGMLEKNNRCPTPGNDLDKEFAGRAYSRQIQRRITTIMIKLSRLKGLIQDKVSK